MDAFLTGGGTSAALLDASLPEELGRVWKCAPGAVTPELVAGCLRKIGVDHVISSECAAQAAQARAEALLDERLKEGGSLILSNDPAAWRFLWAQFPAHAEQFAFYPSELELFGIAAREYFGAEQVFAFTPPGGSDTEEESDVEVNPFELYRVLVRTGAESDNRRAAAVERFPTPAVSGKYGLLLQKLARSADADFERLAVHADGRTLRCALCRNLGQARRAIENIGQYDVIRIIS